MKSRKQLLIGIVGLFGLLVMTGHAMAIDFDQLNKEPWFDETITFKGRILDGPLTNHIVQGECRYSSQGDVQLQKGPCTLNVLKLTKSGEKTVFKMRDPRARLAIVGSNRQLEMTIGIPISGIKNKGNNKLTAFKVTAAYDRTIALTKLSSDPTEIIGSSINLLGTSVSQGGTADDPDCLLWDDLCGTDCGS